MQWDMVKLGDVFSLQMGKTPSRANNAFWENGIFPWVSIADMTQSDIFISETKEQLSKIAIEGTGIKKVPKDTVILSFKLSVGKVAITRKDLYTNEAIMAFINLGKYEVDTLFLYHLFLGMDWSQGRNRAAMGITLNKKILEETKIHLPQIDEQKRIAAILDKAHSIRQKRQQNLENADALIKSVFLDMFGDPVINPKGWKSKEFDFFAKIDTKMTTDFEKYSEQPHIGIDSIEKETGNLVGYRTVKEDNLVSGKYKFTPKHIIYSKIRPNLNKVALPNFSGLCSADAYPILPKDNCERLYLAHIMRSKLFLEHILPLSGRTNIPKANKEQIRKFVMPLPPINLQNQFAEIVIKIEAQKAKQQEHLYEADQVFKALQQQFFG